MHDVLVLCMFCAWSAQNCVVYVSLMGTLAVSMCFLAFSAE